MRLLYLRALETYYCVLRELLSGLEDSFRSLGEGGRKMMFEVRT
jgi:hypothetical protein